MLATDGGKEKSGVKRNEIFSRKQPQVLGRIFWFFFFRFFRFFGEDLVFAHLFQRC